MTAFIFMAVASACHAIFSYGAAKLSAKIGFKHLIMVSAPFLILYYLLLNSITFIQSLGIPVVLIAVFGGTSNAFFWVGYHTDFAKSTTKKNSGKKLGFVRILISLASSLGPLVGAFLITRLDFHYAFMIVIGIIILSLIPLLMRKDKHEPFKFEFKDIRNKFGTRAVVAHMGKGIEASVRTIAWPLFIYFVILDKGITLLGSVTSLSLLASLVVTYFVANHIDKKINFLYKISSFMNAAIWIVRNFVKTYLAVFIIDALYGVSNTTHTIGFNKICYDKARKKKMILEYMTIREIIICTTHTFVYILLGLINNYNIMFIIAALGSLMFLAYKE